MLKKLDGTTEEVNPNLKRRKTTVKEELPLQKEEVVELDQPINDKLNELIILMKNQQNIKPATNIKAESVGVARKRGAFSFNDYSITAIVERPEAATSCTEVSTATWTIYKCAATPASYNSAHSTAT